jgi:CTP synthase (UTP-ammonia lyase)
VAARPVRIGIIGDFNPEYRSHQATNAALRHAAASLSIAVDVTWVPTTSLRDPGADRALESFNGLWAASGSPYSSMEGALNGIRFARVRNWPFTGT